MKRQIMKNMHIDRPIPFNAKMISLDISSSADIRISGSKPTIKRKRKIS
jgi:hypothetical protein